MKKKIIQSLAVLSMTALMMPVCIQSNNEMNNPGHLKLTDNYIFPTSNDCPYIYSDMLTLTPTKEIKNTIMIKESNPDSIIEVMEEPVTKSKDVNKIEKIRKNTEDYIPEPMVKVEKKNEEIVEEPIPETYLSESDIRLIATVTMAEAEGECEYGQRLVIDTILNRMDSKRFPNTVSGVIYQKNQFSCIWDGRIDVCYVKDEIYQLVVEELNRRTDHNVIFFRGGCYPNYGTPMLKVGGHYFSS